MALQDDSAPLETQTATTHVSITNDCKRITKNKERIL